MTIREIKPEDIPSLFDIRIKTWHNSNGAEEMLQMGITHESVIKMMEKTHRGWLAEVDGDIVGFTIGNQVTGEMWVIAVLNEFENRGIGRSLMQKIEKWLFDKGADKLWLVTDPNEEFRAVGFYHRLGWQDWKIEQGSRYMIKLKD